MPPSRKISAQIGDDATGLGRATRRAGCGLMDLAIDGKCGPFRPWSPFRPWNNVTVAGVVSSEHQGGGNSSIRSFQN
jgi:hypothetical protein